MPIYDSQPDEEGEAEMDAEELEKLFGKPDLDPPDQNDGDLHVVNGKGFVTSFQSLGFLAASTTLSSRGWPCGFISLHCCVDFLSASRW